VALTAPPRAFVPDLAGERVVLWAVGDSADGSARAARVAAAIPDAAELVLYLGDVYSNGTRDEYERHYAPLYGHLAEATAPCPGNHEWGNHAVGYDAYWTRARGVAPPPWYAFRAAGWLLLSLNTEEPCGPGSPQLAWLAAQLAGSEQPVLAFWHRPRLSAGEHGDQADVEPLWAAVRGRARLVLSGHDHNLQRFHPVDGITQFVVGAGGRSSYQLTRSWRRHLPARIGRRLGRRRWQDPRLAFGNDADDGVLRVELTPARARFALLGTDGRVLDAGDIAASPPPR
jgi:hypothetical protein